MADYLSDAFDKIAMGYVESARARQDENRQIRLQKMAIDEARRIRQEEVQREFAYNSSMGMNIQKNANLLAPDDPKRQKELQGIGQVMQATGMPANVIMDYMKATKPVQETGAERIARRKTEQEQRYIDMETSAWKAIDAMPKEDLKNPDIRKNVITKHFGNLPRELKQKNITLLDDALRIDEKTTKPTAPPVVQSALIAYRTANNQMNAAKLKGEQSDEDIMADLMDTINNNADIVGDWEESQGQPRSLDRMEVEDTPASFLNRLLGKKTVKKPVMKKPGAGKKEITKETLKKPSERAGEIAKEKGYDPNKLTQKQFDEIKAQLQTEGLVK